MKNILWAAVLFSLLTSCTAKTGKSVPAQAPLTPKRPDCALLSDKKFLYQIADSILEHPPDGEFWSLMDIDTGYYFSRQDYFTSDKIQTTLVILGGEAGFSSGTSRNILMLFSCTEAPKLIWAEQFSELSAENILDLNGDGIKEIVSRSSATWQGTCNEAFEIINFKHNKRHSLFSAISYSIIGCGRENLYDLLQQGDTMELQYDCSLLPREAGTFAVRQIRTVKIFTGGKTDDEVMEQLLTQKDTSEHTLP